MTARQVVLDGGSPWGFRMHGGNDVGSPLRISRVNPGSKAALKGIREGDTISAINGNSTRNLDNSEAHSLLRNAGQQLHLSLNEDGLSSPRRRTKQPIGNSSVPDPKSASNEASIRNNEEIFKKGGKHLEKDKTKAEVHRPSEKNKETAKENGVWSPAQPAPEEKPEEKEENEEKKKLEDEPIPPVWTPKSAQASPVAERKEFRPVNFESPTLPRKKYIQEVRRSERSAFQPVDYTKNEKPAALPPWQQQGGDKTPESVKTPGSPGLSLPRAPNPTVTLLQKAREGHLPKGAHYLNNNMSDSYSESEHRIHRNEVFYSSKDDLERPKKIEIIPKPPVHGIGPLTKEGIPLVLRSEVTDENREKWYKRMYESLHKQGKDGGYSYQAGSSSGYQSEPENLVYDSSRQVNKYQTLDRRRSERDKENDYVSVTLPRSRASTPRYETYKNQPGRIENYEPGHSSIRELEAKQWWDEVLEIFDRQEERSVPVHKTGSPKSFMTYALKDAGYLNDPQHVIKRVEEDFQSSLSPQEQKEAYRIIQKGGEVPLRGLRKPAPERPKEPVDFDFLNQDQNIRDLTPDSARKYVESEVTIHYKSPVRSETKAYLSEEELARRQAESMKRIYQEERRRKYLQELQDMNSRRHADNFIPSQKSPISLHRYDDFPFDHNLSYSPTRFRDSSSEPVLVARGLYDFAGRRPRELAFRRGDIIFIIRRLDKNWCEGELNGAVGLFPISYVEIIPYNEVNPKYGRARAKYDFIPQTSLELLARKGDMITLIRRIDDNWFEGRIGERTGIIPTSYCHVLVWPRSTSNRLPVRQEKSKPVASPAAHSLIHNGKVPTKHSYVPWYSGPNSPGPSTASSAASGIANFSDGYTNINHRYGDAHVYFADEDFATNRPNKTSAMQPLNISINPRSEPALYQVLFNHIPNNDDELELVQGETVLVVEKCEDGWYVGSNPMTGKIGIFPGNHVRRMSPEFV